VKKEFEFGDMSVKFNHRVTVEKKTNLAMKDILMKKTIGILK